MPFWLRMSLFLVGLVVVVGLTTYYVHRRAAELLRLGRPARLALLGALLAGPVALMTSRLAGEAIGPTATLVLGGVGAAICVGTWISTVLMGTVDVLSYLGRHASARASAVGQASFAEPPSTADVDGADVDGADVDGADVEAAERDGDEATDGEETTDGEGLLVRGLGRRALLKRGATGVALSVGFGSASYGAAFGRHDYELNEIPVPIPGLDSALDGYRIAQISDIHFGSYVGDPELRSAVALMRRARPDLIVMTGDLLDHDPAYAPWLGRLIRQLDSVGARDGVVVIPGNHDYYAGVEVVLGVSARAGARVLKNQGVVLHDRLALLGVDDVWARRNGQSPGPDLDAAIAQVPRDLPRVLLCHNPEFFPDAQGKVALQLSGHTHGGQVNLGVRPADLVLDYVHGLYDEGGSRLYVNRGFGTAGPPTRVGAPPEVNVAVLMSA